MNTYGDIMVAAGAIRSDIADADEKDERLTADGAKHIAAVLAGVPADLRSDVFGMLDNSPGRWGYTDNRGRDFHWKLRQFRNYHRDLFVAAMKGE